MRYGTPLSEKKNIDLTTEIQPDLPPMFQDQSRVQQILNNLLSNAIKFTPEGGRIRVAASCNGRDELLLRVVNTGVGIAEEDRQIIFEKFRQGKTALPGGNAITREYSGTGLGLSIVKELCRLLDGEVTVESEVGLGSTFTVRLPWKLQSSPAWNTDFFVVSPVKKAAPDDKTEPCAEVVLYADGTCSGNPGPGGWAFILRHPRTGKELHDPAPSGRRRTTAWNLRL